jgi:hypothetical protein
VANVGRKTKLLRVNFKKCGEINIFTTQAFAECEMQMDANGSAK